MKLLLDTCTFLWAYLEDRALSDSARKAITDPENDVLLSSVSAAEIATKFALRKLRLPAPPRTFVPTQREAMGVAPLALTEEAALTLDRLPAHHRDPFDRLLVCQAIADGLTIVTPDPLVTQYPVNCLW